LPVPDSAGRPRREAPMMNPSHREAVWHEREIKPFGRVGSNPDELRRSRSDAPTAHASASLLKFRDQGLVVVVIAVSTWRIFDYDNDLRRSWGFRTVALDWARFALLQTQLIQ
jgi:hypothetical protein